MNRFIEQSGLEGKSNAEVLNGARVGTGYHVGYVGLDVHKHHRGGSRLVVARRRKQVHVGTCCTDNRWGWGKTARWALPRSDLAAGFEFSKGAFLGTATFVDSHYRSGAGVFVGHEGLVPAWWWGVISETVRYVISTAIVDAQGRVREWAQAEDSVRGMERCVKFNRLSECAV